MGRQRITVRNEGPLVILIIDGRATPMPWNVAKEVASTINAKANLAQEVADPEKSIFDDALMIRSGGPTRLGVHPDIRKEAEKEAEHNSDLRKYLPGGIKERGQTLVGMPIVRKGESK